MALPGRLPPASFQNCPEYAPPGAGSYAPQTLFAEPTARCRLIPTDLACLVNLISNRCARSLPATLLCPCSCCTIAQLPALHIPCYCSATITAWQHVKPWETPALAAVAAHHCSIVPKCRHVNCHVARQHLLIMCLLVMCVSSSRVGLHCVSCAADRIFSTCCKT